MDILKRQAKMAEQARLVRETQKVQKVASMPPKQPMGPYPDISHGIAFGTRRNVGKGRKRKSRRTRKNRK